MINNNTNPIDIQNTILKIKLSHPAECRICLESNNEKLLYPCKCKFPVHKKCLVKWIKSTSNNIPNKCEICKTKYDVDFIIIVNSDTQISNHIIENNNNNKICCYKTIIYSFVATDIILFYNFLYYQDDNYLHLYVLFFFNFLFFCFIKFCNNYYDDQIINYSNLH